MSHEVDETLCKLLEHDKSRDQQASPMAVCDASCSKVADVKSTGTKEAKFGLVRDAFPVWAQLQSERRAICIVHFERIFTFVTSR